MRISDWSSDVCSSDLVGWGWVSVARAMTLIFPVVRPMRHPLTGGARGAPLPSRRRSDAAPMAPGRDSGPVLLLVSTPCAAHFAAIGHDRRGGLSSGAKKKDHDTWMYS